MRRGVNLERHDLPSPDDAWRIISKKATKEMLETVGVKGAK